jgi:pimeloyl-ACP methyl ester carboxylesterase
MSATCSREVRLADGRILQAQTTGAADGQAVLLLHSALGSRLVHDPLAAAAADVGIRLLSYDRPGYGGSTPQPGRTVADTAADVAAIADQLGVDRLAVWGESGGCPFALACAALLPDRVAAAAAVSPLAPYQAPGLDWFAGMADDVAQMHRLAVAGRDALQQAIPQLAEVLTSTDLDRFIEVSRPALPPPDQAILATEAAAHLLANLREGLAPGAEGGIEDGLALVAPWVSGWRASACRSVCGPASRTATPRPDTPAGSPPPSPAPSCAYSPRTGTCRSSTGANARSSTGSPGSCTAAAENSRPVRPGTGGPEWRCRHDLRRPGGTVPRQDS